MELKGRIAVVTGAASGIGAALCHRFAEEGAAGVVVADLDLELATRVAAQIGGVARQVDVSNEEQVQELVAFTNRTFGRLEVFCSNAGIGISDSGLSATDADWQRVWQVNTMAHVYAARAVLPQMLEAGEGYLVQTASAAGLLTHVDSATYAVTKHAAVAFAEWLAVSYGDRGIRVSCLCPQGVKTPMLLGKDGQRKTFLASDALEASDVAAQVVECMRAERFLVLPHPEVLTYLQRKAGDVDRWIRGMRKVKAAALAAR